MLDKKELDKLGKQLRELMQNPCFEAIVTVLRVSDEQALDAIRTLPDLQTEEARSQLRFNESLRNQFRGALKDRKHDPFK